MSSSNSMQDRVIRVFVSSTFRDMQAERDELVLKIFPQLRRLCEERGVTWGEIDLRWGITEEQSQRGEVLPICLEEIKRCRPYFIGLLGERYGWIPDAISDEVIEREPWIKQHSDGTDKKSVTELEILHGVLNNPEMADHAFFYFRAPTFIDRLSADQKQEDFVSENAQSLQKLNRLKDNLGWRTRVFPKNCRVIVSTLGAESDRHQAKWLAPIHASENLPRSKVQLIPHILSGTTQRRRDLSPRILQWLRLENVRCQSLGFSLAPRSAI